MNHLYCKKNNFNNKKIKKKRKNNYINGENLISIKMIFKMRNTKVYANKFTIFRLNIQNSKINKSKIMVIIHQNPKNT